MEARCDEDARTMACCSVSILHQRRPTTLINQAKAIVVIMGTDLSGAVAAVLAVSVAVAFAFAATGSAVPSSWLPVVIAAAAGVGVGLLAGVFFGRHLPQNSISPPTSDNATTKNQPSLASRPAYTPGQIPPMPPSSLPSFGKKIHIFDPSQLTSAYNLMISTVTPRPIALVSSRDPKTGVDNLAPFSYFGCLGHDPPMLAIGFCRNRNGQLKDSIRNILASNEFAVQIVSEWYLDAANHTCGAFSSETDEFVESGLTKAMCEVVQAPRVQQAGVVYECQLVHVHPVTNPQTGQPTTEIILAQVIRIHVDESLLLVASASANKDDPNQTPGFDPLKPEVDTTKLQPLGRLGGNLYTTMGEIVDIPRPQVFS